MTDLEHAAKLEELGLVRILRQDTDGGVLVEVTELGDWYLQVYPTWEGFVN